MHGTPSRAAVWRRVVPALAVSRRVFVFDLLGFGDSERRVDQHVSVAVHGQVLRQLVERWQLDRPAVVGHDIGGATVLRAHLVEGVPVSKIALIDAVVLSPWITPRTRQMQREVDHYDSLPDPGLGASIREHLSSATSRPLEAETFEHLFAQWEGAEGQALYLRNLACFDEGDTEDFEPLLPSISVPVLILWGEEDAWLPVATSERVAALIPNARRVLVPNAGHFSMEDEPETIARELVGFSRERHHSSYLSAFANIGLTLQSCHEPVFDHDAVEILRPSRLLPPEAAASAYLGLPAVLVWELETGPH
ncbi:MAG: alpha/beta hydrolase [Actinobacteria bacterium]|nr:alpha/beta hydrolase [Actinomycetota bacterium]